MTMKSPITVACPFCQHEQSALIYRTLNVQVNPEDKKKLFDGEINAFQCEGCQQRVTIDTQFLYHDMILRLAVQYFPVQAINDPQFLSQFDANGRLKNHKLPAQMQERQAALEYLKQPHIVFSMDELRKYVFFRERLFTASSENNEKLN